MEGVWHECKGAVTDDSRWVRDLLEGGTGNNAGMQARVMDFLTAGTGEGHW